MEDNDNWFVGPLVATQDSRLEIEGDYGLHCGEILEIQIAPQIWLRGTVESDWRIKTKIGMAVIDGWYLNIVAANDAYLGMILLIPGMMARRYVGRHWPEPELPFEGQRHHAGNHWMTYKQGVWVREDD